MNQSKLNQALEKLLAWTERQHWYGYDPYDLKALPFVICIISKSRNSKILVYIRELIFELFYMFPVFFRKFFNIKKTQNAKGIGLMASAYLELYETTGNKNFLEKAISALKWLDANYIKDNQGIGWGYPFDWQSTRFIPAYTPNGIVTTAVGEAFWKIYLLTKKEEYLLILEKIGIFLLSLPRDNTGEDQLCFSYTPLFINHVHNLNLFVAEFLLKTGSVLNKSQWIKLANQAVNYTLAHQHYDGSFDYNGPPEKPANFIDHYHTGFVLRMLFSIWKLTKRKDVYDALLKGYHFYTNYLFTDQDIPKLKPSKTYRIDIHSCSEAIICLSTFSEVFPDAKKKAERILLWTIKTLQDRKGFFYYGILKSRFSGRVYKSKIPYFRWGQAWMMKAFATYFNSNGSHNPAPNASNG